MPKVSFGAEVGSWDHFNRSLRDKDLPPVAEEQRLVLETAAKEAMALKGEQLRLRAAAQGASRRLDETIARGRPAESRLRAYLKAAYGATSLELIKHGLKPRPRGRFRETPEMTPGFVAPEGAALPGEAAARKSPEQPRPRRPRRRSPARLSKRRSPRPVRSFRGSPRRRSAPPCAPRRARRGEADRPTGNCSRRPGEGRRKGAEDIHVTHRADDTLKRADPEFRFGEGKISGVLAVFLGWLGWAPSWRSTSRKYLSTPAARSAYPMSSFAC